MLGIKSPLAPKSYPDMPEVSGVKLASVAAGLKYKERPDILLVTFPDGATVSGVFTKSKTASAAVDWCRKCLEKSNLASALLVNAGNANAFTGAKGFASVAEIADSLASKINCHQDVIYQASTGVIGIPLDETLIINWFDELLYGNASSSWMDAAVAITTTDTYPKISTQTIKIANKTITINGVAKGSGMIAPDMATMLAFIFTDADIPQHLMQEMLAKSCLNSFNCITVDGDTSTSDTVLMFATGKSGVDFTDLDDNSREKFIKALNNLTLDLAWQIVKDGEGASKFIDITVNGAKNNDAAHKIAMSIANSPLVKTAIAGNDPNWGRIVMAIGKAGETADRDLISITIGGVKVAENGMEHPDYKEEMLTEYMKGHHINIEVNLAINCGKATVWTCDLTKRYIEINADYRS